MNCENCSNNHDQSYGSGRFCSQKCARSFSTLKNREEINNKRSMKMSGQKSGKLNKTYLHLRKPLELVRDRKTFKRRLVEDGIKKNQCEICHQKPVWNGKQLVLQLHHIDGNSKNNKIENLQLLCPNCHTQTDNFTSKKRIAES